MKIFYTDLDNTLIYSYKKEIGEKKRGVEVYRGKEVSFMTRKSFQLLKEISKKVMIVPVTTRTVEQYKRVELGIEMPYALTCNGGVLLEKGERDIGWYYDSLKLVEGCTKELWKAQDILECDKNRILEVRFIEELFVFTKSEEPERIVHELREKLDLNKIDVFRNGVKVYVVPKILSKGNAVKRLSEKLEAEYVIAAGDSEFDLTMIEEADKAVIPELLAEKWQRKEKQAEKEQKKGKQLEEKYIIIGKEKVYSDELLEYVFEEVKE